MIQYQIVEAPESSASGITFRGAVKEFWKCRDHEVILVGPAESGKTFGGLHKLDALMWKYPGAQAALVRKFASTMAGTVCQTMTKVIDADAIRILGGTSPERYIYPNGSQVWVGGMDNPSKVLGGERDFIYVNQAEELSLDDWETLLTRVTGRAANSPYAQLFGDCNPAGTRHWIRSRQSLTRLLSIHRDNPTLYDDQGCLTARGKVTMDTLNNLSGVRRQRLLEGQWATAEGVVYDAFNANVHVVDRSADEFVAFYMTCDEGYTNPAVILVIGEDADGRWHLFKEFYKRGVLQDVVVQQALEWQSEFHATMTAVDAAAAGLLADMRDVGVRAYGAKGRVLDGIQAIQNRLKVQGDGKPQLTVSPSCKETINEFENYVWKPEKDEPVKTHDHALDALRYLDNALSLLVGRLPDQQPDQTSKWTDRDTDPSDDDEKQSSWTRRF